MKTCPKCNEDKVTAEFHRAPRNKDGLANMCKACTRAYHMAYRKKNPEKVAAYGKKCYDKNREKILAKNRATYWANLDESREYHRKKAVRLRVNYLDRLAKTEQRRRDRIAAAPGGGFNKKQWAEILETFNHCCAYCLEPCEKLETDHFRPLAKGGEHDPSNIVPACRRCNAIKKDRLIFEWLPMMERSGILRPKQAQAQAAE